MYKREAVAAFTALTLVSLIQRSRSQIQSKRRFGGAEGERLFLSLRESEKSRKEKKKEKQA